MSKRICYCLAALLAASCAGKDLIPEPAVPLDTEEVRVEHGMIVLGKQLDDPYSVENMSRALSVVYPTKATRVVLSPTDLYVRFLPEDDRQLEVLEQRGLELLDHPVDFEILREGDYYHDPEVEEGHITWQYAVVPKGFVFPPGIRREILEECYIPDDDPATKADGLDWAAVEREAFRLSGNGSLLDGMPGTRAEEAAAKPQGRITIVDAARGGTPEGVRGVRVSCNTFVKFAHAYTDEEGRYEMTQRFSSRVRYRLVFKNSAGFAIGFNLLLCPASVSTLGRHEATGLDVEVTENSDKRLFSRCVVNNAGFDYYRRCEEGSPAIKTPPANLRIWLFQGLSSSSALMMQQGVLVDGSRLVELLGEYAALVKLFLPDITLGLKGSTGYGEIYAQAIHELSHASHFMLAGREYWDRYARFILESFVTSGFVTYGVGTEEDHGYCEVGEMWAYAMQSQLWRERYPETARDFGLRYWFHPQIFLQLSDNGLSFNKIYQVLSEDVTDRSTLQKKLTSYYPEHKSAINQTFATYN
ncbi:MAG: hypothetical protein K5910_03175 [Bacteroidales bacterium]|nr:hypothetical protein [Bacteroidales bacterium]